MNTFLRLFFALFIALCATRAWAPLRAVVGSAGGVTTATCTAPLACSPSSGATAFTWSGATINGSSIAVGDMLYGAGATTYSNLAAVAQGSFLTSAGVLSAPVWSVTPTVLKFGNTADSTLGFRITEPTAATAGTVTSGIPNQVLLKVDTLATSTQSPLAVYSQGNHVFAISPSTAQILATSGSVNAPPYGFAAASSAATGMYFVAGQIRFSLGGADQLIIANNVTGVNSGTSTQPGLSDTSGNTGISWLASSTASLVDATDGEWVRFGSRFMQPIRGSADATAYAINARKARGTANSPAVITTGDDLLTINGYGYVGATNTYRNVASVRFDSIGTISDATNGIGGEIVLGTQKQGVDTAPQDSLKLDQFGHLVSLVRTANTPAINTCTNGAVVGTDNAMLITFSGANTTCSINFGTAFVTNAPVCVASAKTVAGTQVTDASASTSVLTITPSAAYANTDTVNVICIGRL